MATGALMGHEDECEDRQADSRVWRGEIDFPKPEMVTHFSEWWEREGWWNFCSWHNRTYGNNSEWEQFMRGLCGLPCSYERRKPATGNVDPEPVR